MNNFREINNDILKDQIDFREETNLAFVNDEDGKHTVKFDEFSEKILNNIPKQNRKFVRKQFELLNSIFLDYIIYQYEKIHQRKISFFHF